MKAFISYSHSDTAMLEILHKHLAQLKRDNIITTWTDQEIAAGNRLDTIITKALTSSQLFFALLSPEYIASRYCYETEFQKAQEMEQRGNITIVPIILEPCDWLSTPFKDFMALPKDGKPISTWENRNTAFLDIAQGIRKLVQHGKDFQKSNIGIKQEPVPLSRNYRVKKDFDSIAKMEFVENSFKEVKDSLKRYLPELEQLDNIKTRILTDNADNFQCLLSNRNKVGAESKLTIGISNESSSFQHRSNENQLIYSIENNRQPTQKAYILVWDDFHLFWAENSFYSAPNLSGLDTKAIAESIWEQWLASVGIA